jgi:hypothetical protein
VRHIESIISVVGRTGRTWQNYVLPVWQMAEVVFFGCAQHSTRGTVAQKSVPMFVAFHVIASLGVRVWESD